MEGLSRERGAALVDGMAVERRKRRVWKRTRWFRSATVARHSACFARLRGSNHEEEETQEGQVGHREH